MFQNKTILITGGTGYMGQALTQRLLNLRPKKIIIYSRSEYKQFCMERDFQNVKLRFFIGDIRDTDRLETACQEVDYIIHAAALKRIDQLEYNPEEAVKTNVFGSMSVISAAIKNNVKKVVAISTDKAVNPVNLYGSTKLTMEKLIINGNAISGNKTLFSCARYGNVEGSTGSVIPFYQSLIDKHERILPLTDKRMTRFHITKDQAVDLILMAFKEMQGGEIFIAKCPSFKVTDLIKSMGCTFFISGIRPGEKLHEILITSEDSSRTYENKNYYVIHPQFDWIENRKFKGKKVKEGFTYYSNTNKEWLYDS